jgi:hypothetical protein
MGWDKFYAPIFMDSLFEKRFNEFHKMIHLFFGKMDNGHGRQKRKAVGQPFFGIWNS